MRICAVVKYPPVQGGVSAQSYWMCHLLAARGHQVHVVTNAGEVEPEYRLWFLDGDHSRLEADAPNGGLVRVRSTGGWTDGRANQIPAANPYTTKLAAMAAETVRDQDCDLLLAWYLEPYGLAANLASCWTGRPFAVRHAGSDRYRLMSHPEMSAAYKEVLRASSGVLTAGAHFSGFGVPPERTVQVPGAYRPDEFSPAAPAMDVNAVIAELAARGCPYVANTAPLRDDVPVIGAYGKAGPTKGTFDLVAALGELRRRGVPFQFLMMGGGPQRARSLAAAEEAGIAEATWTLPFLAPWRVPGFIRACTAVCFLERGFPVKRHTPAIAAEVLSCGTPLVVSAEIMQKQPYRERLTDTADHFRVQDPTDLTELSGVLSRILADPRATAAAAGRAGATLLDRCDAADFGARWERALAGVGASATPSPTPEEAAEALMREHCPATVRLLGDRVPPSPPPQNGTLLDVYDLTRRLRESGRLDGDDPMAQMARAEHLFLWFLADREGASGVPVFPVPATTRRDLADLDDRLVGTLRPVASVLLRVEAFGIDVAAYAHRVAADRADAADPALQTGPPRLFLFQKRPELGGAIHEIDERVAAVLASCDGTNTMASLDQGRADEAVRPPLRRLIERLHRSGAIGFAGHGPLLEPAALPGTRCRT